LTETAEEGAGVAGRGTPRPVAGGEDG
jgi:hypothetical protein